ncbi:MAG: DUF4331 family protein [Gemmatimonadetes bacterium]|nr:DUF4331 family protein [Gemmatimonadota bacterium]
MRNRLLKLGARTSLCALAGLLALAGPVMAADHAEAPGTRADLAGDIADLYAWHEGNTLIAIITYAGLQAPTSGQDITFDEGVTYTLNIDNDGDNIADIMVDTSFFTETNGKRGVLVQNLPGVSGDVSGFLNSTLKAEGRNRAFAGLVDDPFFFDLQGFQETLATGTLSFDGTRDSVAGLNASAIALRMPLSEVLGNDATINLWATTSR